MFFFWTALAVLACVATASVIWPLLRHPRQADGAGTPDDRANRQTAEADEAKRLAVYKDRRREIEADEQAGRLSADEARLAIDELLADVAGQFPDAAKSASTASGPAGRPLPIALIIAVALIVPGAGVLVYDRVGAPGVVGLDDHELRGEMNPAKLGSAIAELRERTRQKPTDGEGWAMLAEALRIQGDLPASAQAFAQAAQYFTPPSARLLADYADVLVSVQGGNFGPEPVGLLQKALSINPREPKALALMGAALYRNGDLPGALATLKQLREILPPESAQAGAIGEAIARLENNPQGGTSPAAGTAGAPNSAGAGAPTAAGSGTPPVTNAGAPPAAGAGPTSPSAPLLAGRIELDPKLAGRLPPGTVLFIAARPAEGPRMPLAAKRLIPDRYPLAFELSDADAMNPAAKLSTAGALIVEARLSASGNAMRASGDLFGLSPVVRPGSLDIGIRIDQIVP